MATDLKFVQDGTKYVCDITPSEATAIQIERDEKKTFTVYGYIDDLTPVPLFTSDAFEDIIFQLDVPSGVNIRMTSWSPVKAAKML